MTDTEPPKTPNSGRSRFSKVLPAPPSRPQSKALPMVPSIPTESVPPLPTTPLTASLSSLARKPVRKPVNAGVTSPIDVSKALPTPDLPTSAPPSQIQSPPPMSLRSNSQPNDSPLPPPPPPMSIPRRPVVPLKQQTQTQTQTQTPPTVPLPKLPFEREKTPQEKPTLTPTPTAPPIDEDDGEISPSDSFSSILSAYSRSSTEEEESVMRSSNGYESQMGSEVGDVMSKNDIRKMGQDEGTVVPKKDKALPPVQELTPANTGASRPEDVKAEKDRESSKVLPPLPLARVNDADKRPATPKKDTMYMPDITGSDVATFANVNTTPKSSAALNALSNSTPSPPRERIWQRRQSVKSDRALELPDLKLPKSHGSTAASAATTSQPPTNTKTKTNNQPSVNPSPLVSAAASQTSTAPPQAAGKQTWQPSLKPYVSPIQTQSFSPEETLASTTSPFSPEGGRQFKAFTPTTSPQKTGDSPSGPELPASQANQALPSSAARQVSSPRPAAGQQQPNSASTPGHQQNAETNKPEAAAMGLGSKYSSLKAKISNLDLRHRNRKSNEQDEEEERPPVPSKFPSKSEAPLPQPPPRLPTPDYNKQDVKPGKDGLASTGSGSHPPTPPNEASKSSSTPIASTATNTKTQASVGPSSSIQRKAVGGVASGRTTTAAAAAASSSSSSRDAPNLSSPAPAPSAAKAATSTGAPPSEKRDIPPSQASPLPAPSPLTKAAPSAPPASPLPPPPPVGEGGHPTASSVRDFAPNPPRPSSRGSMRPSSRGSSVARPGSRQGHFHGPPPPGPHRPGPRFRAPVITDFKEINYGEFPAPDPRALRFPKTEVEPSNTGVAAPAGPGGDAIYRPNPLRPSMMACHLGHKIMRQSRQPAWYALACQTCGVADREERWTCAGCHVRVCGGCFRTLNGNGRSLATLMEGIQARGGEA